MQFKFSFLLVFIKLSMLVSVSAESLSICIKPLPPHFKGGCDLDEKKQPPLPLPKYDEFASGSRRGNAGAGGSGLGEGSGATSSGGSGAGCGIGQSDVLGSGHGYGESSQTTGSAGANTAPGHHNVIHHQFTPSEYEIPSYLKPGAMGAQGQQVAHAVVNSVSAISQAMAGFAKADYERSVRYQPQSVYNGPSAAQKAQQNEAFYRDLAENQRRITEEINRHTVSADEKQEVLDSFKRISERASDVNKRLKDYIASKQPKYAKVPEPEIKIPVEFETEGLSEKQVNYLHLAASEAAALKTGDDVYEQGAERWNDRFKRAQRYFRDEALRAKYAKVKLAQTAKTRYQLPEIQSDSFENYEIISAANQLSRDREMFEEPSRRFYVSLTLNQAYQFAQEGDFYASSKMLENALSDRDFAHGAVKGLYQNVYDTVTGLWHMVRHPIETAKALGNAIVNCQQTFELITEKLSKIATEFPYYDAEKKGQILGYLATEIAMAVGTGGVSLVGELGKIAKVSEAVAIATEKSLNTLNVLKRINEAKVAGAAAEVTRVGRWMSEGEYLKMQRTGIVQESRSGTTYVAKPADVSSYMSQAKRGSFYVEFDVPSASLVTTREGWAKIIGPNSFEGRMAGRIGQPIPDMPAASNAMHTATKID